MDPETVGAGSVDVGGAGLDPSVDNGASSSVGDGGNPAWSSILEKLPTSLHSQITPELQKWDQGVQNRFKDLQSQYDPYKPFVEEKVDPAFIQQALALANAFNQNPRGLYDQIVGAFGEEWGLNGNASDQGVPTDTEFETTDINELLASNPQLRALTENQTVLAQYLMSQEEEKQNQIIENNLDTAIESLTQKYGDTWDPDYVFTVAAQDPNVETDYAGAIERAIIKFQGIVGNNAPRKTGPSVVTPSSSVPSDRVDVSGLSSKDTRSLVAHLLSTANIER